MSAKRKGERKRGGGERLLTLLRPRLATAVGRRLFARDQRLEGLQALQAVWAAAVATKWLDRKEFFAVLQLWARAHAAKQT